MCLTFMQIRKVRRNFDITRLNTQVSICVVQGNTYVHMLPLGGDDGGHLGATRV